jgi:hypothetical protein
VEVFVFVIAREVSRAAQRTELQILMETEHMGMIIQGVSVSVSMSVSMSMSMAIHHTHTPVHQARLL